MNEITLRGTPAQIGAEHGAIMAQIGLQLPTPEPALLQLARDCEQTAIQHTPELVEEMRAFAAAAQVPYAAPEVLALGGDGLMQTRTLPAIQAASTLCRMESQADIYAANRDLCTWIIENGCRLGDGPCREVYAQATCAGEPLIFEVQLPVEPA